MEFGRGGAGVASLVFGLRAPLSDCVQCVKQFRAWATRAQETFQETRKPTSTLHRIERIAILFYLFSASFR